MNKKIIVIVVALITILIGALGFAAIILLKQNQILRVEYQQVKSAVEQHKKEVIASKSVKSSSKPTILPQVQQQNQIITSQDIAPYLGGVGSVFCWNDAGDIVDRGSGSLKKLTIISTDGTSKTNYYVLTNKHVLGSSNCTFAADQDFYRNTTGGQYQLSSEPLFFDKADAAFAEINFALDNSSDPIAGLNYSLGDLHPCSNMMPIGSPVYIIGYPAFGESNRELSKITTEGIISGYGAADIGQKVNYFVTAQMDAGNSGGAAITKGSNGLCFLGLPTWINEGVYANTGIVQNINNLK